MKKGLRKTPLDPRDISFHRSFGTVAKLLDNKEYTYDPGLPQPNQLTDGNQFGCRAYTLSHIAGNEDKAIYKPQYSCDKIASVEGTPAIQSGDMRLAMKVGQVYGVQRLDETTEQQAETHRRGAFYSVDKVNGMDWFDSFRLALRNGGTSINTGTMWFPEWENIGPDGILTSQFVFDGTWDTEDGHDYEICGEHIINNQPYLIALSWQGDNYGDHGRAYFSRETFNKVFDVYGTAGFVQPKAIPRDTLTIKLSMLQFLLYYLGRLISFKAYA